MFMARQSPQRDEMLNQVSATLLGRTSRLTRLLMSSGPRELSRTEAGLLSTLADGPRRISELAESEALAQPSISKLVDKLEGKGMVARERAAKDGRVVVVSICSKGLEQLEAARGHIRSQLHAILFELDDEALAALVTAGEVLQGLIGALQRDGLRG
jgi:DNA-binding MarR family transcriptional regulator